MGLMGRPRKTPEEVLSRHVRAPNGCWEWLGSKNKFGYGAIMRTVDGVSRLIGAHRFAYLTWRGEIPDGIDVLHTCDNRCCINPDHLWLGTHGDNMRDMVAKGRHAGQVKTRLELVKPEPQPEVRPPPTEQELRDQAKWAFARSLDEMSRKSA